MKPVRILLLVLLLLMLVPPGSAQAQSYLFSVDAVSVNVFWNEDGTSSIDYVFIFTNNPSASPIDFVDLGLPNSNFVDSSIYADVDGAAITDISRSGYQGNGTGVALGLGANAIQPGQTGRVHAFIGIVNDVLYPDTEGDNYASAVFSPTYFGSSYVSGSTSMRVTFHLPPGVQPEEARYHSAPSGFPGTPEAILDEEGRVTYSWVNADANAYSVYQFGASFPLQYVPESAIVKPGFLEILGIDPGDLVGFTMCCGFFGFIAAIIGLSARSAQKRKLQYLPPKIAIEGHGIKRGLTAIEAALLLEEPLDKILTMILFATIKKDGAKVTSREPLELEIISPEPEGMQPYEKAFLEAFSETKPSTRKKKLQDMMVELVNSLALKMKGFSRRETVAYYKDITTRAWAQVEAADTPEVKSKLYDEVMEWTMLDKDYDDRTRRVFTGGPVIIPTWWGRFDPGYSPARGAPSAQPVSTAGGGGGLSMPHLPGSDFAASVVTSVQGFSSNVIGNIGEFTGAVTNKTNPVPVVTASRSGGSRGGGGCACACACAGCACACAGGGR